MWKTFNDPWPPIGLALAVSADTLTGKVVKITDGDTLYVLDANYKEHQIRLAGIDAPERRQTYGLASRKHLLSIVAGKQVTVEYQKRDRYGRILGKVWVNGVDACLEQAWELSGGSEDQLTGTMVQISQAGSEGVQGKPLTFYGPADRGCFCSLVALAVSNPLARPWKGL